MRVNPCFMSLSSKGQSPIGTRKFPNARKTCVCKWFRHMTQCFDAISPSDFCHCVTSWHSARRNSNLQRCRLRHHDLSTSRQLHRLPRAAGCPRYCQQLRPQPERCRRTLEPVPTDAVGKRCAANQPTHADAPLWQCCQPDKS